jgi:hypothetical protein
MALTFDWEVVCGDAANHVIHFFDSPSDALEHCGRLLYGNMEFLFESICIRLLTAEKEEPLNSASFASPPGADSHWTLQAQTQDGHITRRRLDSKHELFGMLIAEMKRGATNILICYKPRLI